MQGHVVAPTGPGRPERYSSQPKPLGSGKSMVGRYVVAIHGGCKISQCVCVWRDEASSHRYYHLASSGWKLSFPWMLFFVSDSVICPPSRTLQRVGIPWSGIGVEWKTPGQALYVCMQSMGNAAKDRDLVS